MEVYRSKPSENSTDLREDEFEDFFSHSHGMGTNEWTLCSVAPEEWDYTNQTPVKKITCPQCLAEIAHCKTYKA